MQSLYRNSLPVEAPITQGKHTIVLENHGTIWVSGAVDLANYLKADVANARVFGLGSNQRAYLWVQNRDSDWWRDCLEQSPRPIENGVIELEGWTPGSYAVEWWDPWGVKPVEREIVEASGPLLRLGISALERDLACKIKPVPTPAAR